MNQSPLSPRHTPSLSSSMTSSPSIPIHAGFPSHHPHPNPSPWRHLLSSRSRLPVTLAFPCGGNKQHPLIQHASSRDLGPGIERVAEEQPQQLRALKLQVQQFCLPELGCPFPVERHPSYHSLMQTVNSWLLHWMQPETADEKKVLLDSDFTAMGCCIIPWSPYRQRMLLFCELCAWLMCFEEEKNKEVEKGRMIERVLQGRTTLDILQSSREIEALNGLLDLLRVHMSPKLHYRHVEALKRVLIMQIRGDEKGALPHLPSYIASHRNRVHIDHIQVMTEYCLGIELDDETLHLEELNELHAILADCIWWSMELLLFRRDYYRANFQNLPCIVYFHHGGAMTFQESVDNVAAMIEERQKEFLNSLLDLCVSNVARRKPELRAYLRSIPYCLSGMLEWSYRSSMLHGRGHSVGEIRHGLLVMDPERTMVEPCDACLQRRRRVGLCGRAKFT